MGNKFKPGDVCVAQNFEYATYLNGLECTVVSGPFEVLAVSEPCYGIRWADPTIFNDRTDIIEQSYLRLKRPPADYDGNSAGDWDLCPWQPKRERA